MVERRPVNEKLEQAALWGNPERKNEVKSVKPQSFGVIPSQSPVLYRSRCRDYSLGKYANACIGGSASIPITSGCDIVHAQK